MENPLPDTFQVSVAETKITLQKADPRLLFKPSPNFSGFVARQPEEADIHVNVFAGTYPDDQTGKILFQADNISGFDFLPDVVWNVRGAGQGMLITADWNGRRNQLWFSLENRNWELYFSPLHGAVPAHFELIPFAYPTDGLLMYYALAVTGGFMMHASAVEYKGKGLLFTGFSGRGKSTIARLFLEAGARVINDDRILLRNTSEGVRFFNSPMFYPDSPRTATLDHVFLIYHHGANLIGPLDGVDALTQMMAFCIQHQYHKFFVHQLLDQLARALNSVRVARLGFLPQASVVQAVEEWIQ